ncbi:hypothetical protein fh0823_00550 [Francisella halioticida]|uniref:Orn/DAP/Arg decarboxylase 2 N-terminal domain-containing protein n=1 Tax=Francisella halioticida TaxID=549298 RepID=A0ABM6LY57_9GAMM|nr:hypothetical protein [Francisella halioticida]ASG67459.1 hypothetical protein CDV26_02745 [Francisella halioticida]BCD89916.1 hypothetical protein fh0823_00550 [Francisella halioticida]
MKDYIIFDNERLVDYIRSNSLITPCYIYDTTLLDNTFTRAKEELAKKFKNAEIHYAIKANHNPEIISFVKKHNMGIDCVSGGEIKRALEQGINPNRIVFAGTV